VKLLLENFRSFITEQESGLPQIYCDMDGVLVDFERGVVDQINKDLKKLRSMPDSKNLIKIEAALAKAGRKEVVIDDLRGKLETAKPVRDYMYGRVSDDATFWANLPWMPGGKELWAFIAPYKPHILTSPMAKPSEYGKAMWLHENLDLSEEQEVNMSHSKSDWALNENGEPNILIDDWDKNLGPWSYHTGGKKGGPYSKYAIQCVNGNYQAAIAKLKEHGFS
jgi:5'(3')-deoxyribonucleotidase